MPVYEFRCRHCNHKFDRIVSYMKSHSMKCPRCGGFTQKLISTPNLITETSFPWSGVVDKRLGERPIEGRADFNRRMEKKGYVVASDNEVKNML